MKYKLDRADVAGRLVCGDCGKPHWRSLNVEVQLAGQDKCPYCDAMGTGLEVETEPKRCDRHGAAYFVFCAGCELERLRAKGVIKAPPSPVREVEAPESVCDGCENLGTRCNPKLKLPPGKQCGWLQKAMVR